MPLKGLMHDGGPNCNSNPVGIGGGAWKRPRDEAAENHFTGPGHDLGLFPLVRMAYPRDNCAYASGGGACDFDNGGTQVGDGLWDIETYAFVEHSGMTGAGLIAAIVAGGFDKAPLNPPGTFLNITRKEVYDWEVGTAPPPTMYPNSDDADYTTGSGCWSGGALPVGGFVGSRRIISVAVIDCPDAAPNMKNLPQSEPNGAIDIMFLEPIGGYSENNLYAEIVGPAGSENLSVVAEERVILYE
jgi:hypothetical protein